VTIIEDFRLVSVSPHPQLFEPSPMDEPRINFRVHDEKQRCDSKTVPRGSPMSPKGFRGLTSGIVKGAAGQCASRPLAQRPWAPWFECGTNMRTERLNRVRAPQRADNAERTKARPPPRDRAFPFSWPFRAKCRFAGASLNPHRVVVLGCGDGSLPSSCLSFRLSGRSPGSPSGLLL
jgi:hypothetical protein